MPDTPPLDEIIKQAVRGGMALQHTQVPGSIESYDPDTQRAKVQLYISHSRINPDTGAREFYDPPLLVNVPVVFPAILTWPLERGDPGWVQFAERSMDELKSLGGKRQPRDARRFDLSDAVFAPCYFRGEYDASGSDTVLSTAAGTLKIREAADRATKALAIAEKCMDNFNEIKSKFNSISLVTPSGTAGGPTTGFVDTVNGPIGSLDDVAASNVEAEE